MKVFIDSFLNKGVLLTVHYHYLESPLSVLTEIVRDEERKNNEVSYRVLKVHLLLDFLGPIVTFKSTDFF